MIRRDERNATVLEGAAPKRGHRGFGLQQSLSRGEPQRADERGAHQKTVAVVLDAAAVVVEMKARLQGVALGDEILSKDVCDIDILRSLVKTIQPAVSIFFELMKVCEVELITVVAESAEETRA